MCSVYANYGNAREWKEKDLWSSRGVFGKTITLIELCKARADQEIGLD